MIKLKINIWQERKKGDYDWKPFFFLMVQMILKKASKTEIQRTEKKKEIKGIINLLGLVWFGFMAYQPL